MATKKKNLKKPAKATAPAAPTGTAPAGQQAPQPDPTALSIGDLKNLATILDVASTRGAFKAAEMAGVGFLFNKLQNLPVWISTQSALSNFDFIKSFLLGSINRLTRELFFFNL